MALSKSAGRHDLKGFAEYFLSDVCRLEWNQLHEYLFRRRAEKTKLDPPERRGKIDVIIAPRGAAKTSLISLVFPLHALLYRTDPYILLISATQRQASIKLANIRQQLETNLLIRAAFEPELASIKRATDSTITFNGVRIDAFSAGSELRGLTFGAWRPTWIVLDDVESSARVLGSLYRNGLYDWMCEVVENLGNGYTNIDLIGTLLHPEALPARLGERPEVKMVKFASIIAEARNQSLWNRWREILFDLNNPDRAEDARRFYDERREAMDLGAEVLWKQKESYYDLQLMRASRGEASFNKEKQNEPQDDDATCFPMRRLRKFSLVDGRLTIEPGSGDEPDGQPPEIRLDELQIYGFLDPATGKAPTARKAGGDFAAIVTVGVDAVGYIYVLGAWLERAGPSAQIDQIFDLHEQWGYAEFAIEANAFQKQMLEPIDDERARRRRGRKRWDVEVRGVVHRTNKRMRILGLEPLVRNGWLLFRDELDEEFGRQLSDFPMGAHDDAPDALQGAVALARTAHRGAYRIRSVAKRSGSRSTENF